MAQTEADLETRRQDLLLALANAERNFKNAQLFVGIDPSLVPAADMERYRYDNEKAQIELEKARRQLDTLDATGLADLKVARLALETAELQLRRIEGDLAALTLRATAPGVVLYADHPARPGKVQVGDTVWRGQALLYIPNTSRMLVQAAAYDSDYPFLEVGQVAEVVLDAVLDRVFTGRVTELAETARPKAFRSRLRAFQVIVLLEVPDPKVMKPGMTARVRIPVKGPEALVVPRTAVGLAAHGGADLVPASKPQRRIPIPILDASESEIAFAGDVQPGESVLPQISTAGKRAHGNIDWLRLERDDYVFSVAGSGIVEAQRSLAIEPPTVSNTWHYTIVAIAPEGTEVEPGTIVVAFDPSEVLKRLADEEVSFRKVQEEIEWTKTSQDLNLKDLEVQLEEARDEDGKARNRLVQAREFESDLRVRQAEHEAEFAARRAEILAPKLEQVRRQSALQLRILDDRRHFHEQRIRDYRRTLEALQVKTPSRGVVIYETNWRNEKKQIGSQVFRGEEPVLATISGWMKPLGRDPVLTLRLVSRPYTLAVRAEGELLGLKTTTLTAPQIRSPLKVAWLAKEGQIVRAGETVVEFDPAPARLTLQQSENQFQSLGFQVEKTEQDSDGGFNLLRLDQKAAQEELAFAESQIRKDEEIFSRWEIQESLLSAALARFRQMTLEEKAELYRLLVDSDLKMLQIDRQKTRRESDQAQEALSAMRLTTPVSGVLIYSRRGFDTLEIGTEVWSGQPLVEIAGLDKFRAVVHVPEKDFTGVQPGQAVQVTVQALPDAAFPGRVVQVARGAKQIRRETPVSISNAKSCWMFPWNASRSSNPAWVSRPTSNCRDWNRPWSSRAVPSSRRMAAGWCL